jgi:hypothetical protein
MKKIILLFALVLLGCEERYRYPCQNPDNWEQPFCKKPYCSANGTCPEDLSHYVKDKEEKKSSGNNLICKGTCQ